MLNVGIHENLVFSKNAKNDKGTLVLTFKKIMGDNPLELLSSGSSLEAQEQQFFIYPPKIDEKDDSKSMAAKIAEVRDPLTLIASQYMTSDKAKFSKMFEGTGVTAENYNAKLMDETTINKIYANIVDQFIDIMKGFVGDNGKRMRMIFVRQSKAKHYPKLRTRFVESQPFIEPMDVPTTKLAFTKYELQNGLNSGAQVAAAPTVSKDEAKEAESHFA